MWQHPCVRSKRLSIVAEPKNAPAFSASPPSMAVKNGAEARAIYS
jgi:hypothetical protein